jgi:phosphoglycerol transferase MdoB-like AlkP superfamily enzyme
MQSVTEKYDNQDKLTLALGFKDKKTKETIERPSAKHYPVKSEEVNYYGYAETELLDYIRDAIDDAERDHQRLFLTHLTSTTHHPWGIPNNTYEQILGSSKGHNDNLNRYLNAIAFADDWLATILEVLKEKGVANETLLVVAGDQYDIQNSDLLSIY